ncbi:hypothetical protein AAES_136242 [Amazona aestiva]|uniref:Uncharacterized protein n=1 Tax=Amazona aestiva TaxID=12930 RepID=A0A0Q3QTA8_AMAAE|nr:hypothetical protein AAES_136242 [Amazona aestiva]
MAVDFYLAIRLLFTILALILTSVIVRLQGANREQPWESPVAELARESSPGDKEGAAASGGDQGSQGGEGSSC